MKSALASALCLFGLTSGVALPEPDVAPKPVRILPTGWDFKITSLKGPGCPDLGVNPTTGFTTRLTFGQNTVDGSEIYYWYVGYPHLRVSSDGPTHSWCETEIAYSEFADLDSKKPSADYKFRLHKNGTKIISTYDLAQDVEATFEFSYEVGRKEVSTLGGPFKHHISLKTPTNCILDY